MTKDFDKPVTREEIVQKPTADLVIIVAHVVTVLRTTREPRPNMGRAFDLACEELNRRIPKTT